MGAWKSMIPTDQSDVEWAYLAGLIDGEGWIGGNTQGQVSQVKIGMYADTLVQWLGTRFAGCVTQYALPARNETVWTWTLTRRADQLHVLPHVRPFLRCKRDRADAAIVLLQTAEKYKRNTPERLAALRGLQALNGRSSILDPTSSC